MMSIQPLQQTRPAHSFLGLRSSPRRAGRLSGVVRPQRRSVRWKGGRSFASTLTVPVYPDRAFGTAGRKKANATPMSACEERVLRMAVLVRTQGSHQGKWVYSLGPRCILGRHIECDIADIFAENNG